MEVNLKSIKWRVGGICWPTKKTSGVMDAEQLPGSVCLMGSLYAYGPSKRPQFYVIEEKEHTKIDRICETVFEYDRSYGPDIWSADTGNDAAVAIFSQRNKEIQVVLAGKQYQLGDAPWHRRTVNLSPSPLLPPSGDRPGMGNGPELALNTIEKLLNEKRLFMDEESIALEQLRIIRGVVDVQWNMFPAFTAMSFALHELNNIAVNELAVQNAPPRRPKYNPLGYSQRKNRR